MLGNPHFMIDGLTCGFVMIDDSEDCFIIIMNLKEEVTGVSRLRKRLKLFIEFFTYSFAISLHCLIFNVF